MRAHQIPPVTSAALLALTALTSPPAHAAPPGLTGSFRAQSNGQWAQTNDAYHDETVTEQTWTISATDCPHPTDCTGTITSDQGWTAPIHQMSGQWFVKHTIPHWQTCPDGTTADAQQTFKFYPAAPHAANVDATQTNLFAGRDETQGPSGACGINQPLHISMPFKLTRISQ